jgi:hypothetical protein
MGDTVTHDTGGTAFVLHAPFGFRHQVPTQRFGSRHLDRMELIIRDVCAGFGAELAEFNGEADYVQAAEPPA